MQEFEKKSSKKFIPRPAAFKTTLSFGINFLWSHPSELNQIQIMWPFWPKLSFYEKTLAFKGHEGQERPSNFFGDKLREVNFIAESFFSKNIQLLSLQNLCSIAFHGVCFTSAWLWWPLKAKIIFIKPFIFMIVEELL